MSAVHIQRQADHAMGEAIRRLQNNLEPATFATIDLYPGGRVRVLACGFDGRPVASEVGTDLEDCCDLVFTTLAARKAQALG